ncbi:metallophosphoesterase [Noviherbaspirillum aerium]|uniref:metallophosphoesterase n=1 Tax=Noviherbaspirillum aerium TaxID=2588497 RepID=UPI00124C1849|nr:metallophosphoesterase [Noviherbaspirillum aerium]
MKVQIASDLHLDLLQEQFPGYRAVEHTDADVLVIAGDIHHGDAAIAAFADWPVPVIYVNGNHETYHEHYPGLIARLRAASAASGIHYLEGDACVIGGVRFLGCCLWTDYRFGEMGQEAAMAEAEKILYDHRLIRTDEGLFSATAALRMHEASRDWLAEKLDEGFDGPTVVVTHHSPHPNSVHPRFAGSPLNAAFVSDLSPLMGKAKLWIHGHVHDSFDYELAGTRVIANPRGYALNRRAATEIGMVEWENPMFDARLVVEV